jgi:glutathione S-transferase
MSGYVLYGYPQSGSAPVEAALVLTGTPFSCRDLDPEGGLKASDFLAVNPRGQVPALVLPDGTVVTEVPAILAHLADAHPASGLAPPPGSSARAVHDRWMAFTHANLYEGVLRVYYTDRYTTDSAGVPGVRAAAETYVARHFALLEGAMGDGPFLFGPRPMAVDLLIWILVSWTGADTVRAAAPRIADLAEAVAALPALSGVMARHV